MTKRFTINNSNIVRDGYFIKDNVGNFSFPTTIDGSDLIMYHKALNKLSEENEQLKQFIKDLATKGTGRIDLANGYSYSVSAVLTNWKSDVE